MPSEKIPNRLLRCVVLCALAISALAPSSSRAQRDRQAERLSSPILHNVVPQVAAKYKIPGLAVALIEHGELTGVEVFGVRDKNSNEPVTMRTIFEAGSLGETLYAYAVLRLAAEGHFDAGAPLTAVFPLPYIRSKDPTSSSPSTESLYDPRFNQITAIRVMNHTSGMPDWARNAHMSLQSAPGSQWSYSNEGYIYLQSAVEHVTNEPFDDFIKRSVLAPARMGRSGFVWRDEYASGMATGYDRSGAPVEIHRYMRPAAGATLYTTIEDYAHFVTLLLASAPTQHAHESAVSLMLNPTVAADASFSWGLGCGLEKVGDDLLFFNRGFGHGDNSGFQSFFIASRKTGRGLIILTNSQNGLDAAREIVAATIGGDHPIFKSAFLGSPTN